jgi:hypothetical protein
MRRVGSYIVRVAVGLPPDFLDAYAKAAESLDLGFEGLCRDRTISLQSRC